MEKRISSWLRLSIEYFGVAATAIGVSLGTQFTDGKTLADHDRRLAENERCDNAAHSECARFRSVNLSGFSDPAAVHAIDQQIQRALRDFETREHAAAWRKRLKLLNPTLTIVDE